MEGGGAVGRLPRLSRLAPLLERAVPRIPEPRVELEQYTTPADLAVRLAAVAAVGLRGAAADLGAGTCRLSIPLALLSGARVVAVEDDGRLGPLCRGAAEEMGVGGLVEFVEARVEAGSGPLASGSVDVVVSNPPFGVHRRGADREILEYAFSLAPRAVYAILKSGNLAFHARLAGRYGYSARLLWREEFPIPAQMPRHRRRVLRVVVDVIEFSRV